MGHLDAKRKRIADDKLVLVPKDDAVGILAKQRFCPYEEKQKTERVIKRELVSADGAKKKYLVTVESEEYDPDEAERLFYTRMVAEGTLELYKDVKGSLIVFPSDKILEEGDKKTG